MSLPPITHANTLGARAEAPACSGRTFLQLLGRALLPSSGIIWYPDNLRVRLIPGEPLLFNGSLMYNLRFGNQKEHTDDEIWELCRLVGLSEDVLYRGELQVGHNGMKIALSDRINVCLARALLSSVDLLLLSNPLDVLGDDEGLQFLELLKEWRSQRGMACLSADHPPGVSVGLLKKKSVFYVTKSKALEAAAGPLLACCLPAVIPRILTDHCYLWQML